MTINWLYLFEGKVVHIIEQDECPAPEEYADGIHDTIAMDHSKTFKVGDDFTTELQLEHNKDIWIQLGWIPDPSIPVEPNPNPLGLRNRPIAV